jgi:serine/threonine protein kinase/N-acetylneuraminic acid mutarotase
MNQCPSYDQLRQLLTDELNLVDQKKVEVHIEECETCQDVLPTLVADPEIEQWRALLESGSAEDEQCTALLQRLAVLTRLPGSAGEKVLETAPIRWPGPPTERGPLGRLDSFQILKELGSGGMGFVFQAFDERLARIVAIKIMKPELAAIETHRKRFAREARAVAGIKHDHVVAIYDFGDRSDFPPYFVMEFVEGESLSDRLKVKGRFAPAEAAQISRAVALGLAAAHAQGVLHRDIKPSNILFDQANGRIKIADFGLAQLLEVFGDAISHSGQIIGTPAYMSPEQLASPNKVDARTDVYSLGVVLYELLTGQRPHRSEGQALLMQVVHETLHPPHQINSEVPTNLETICLKAMAKRPDDRYQTATELADDLQRYLNGQPVTARPSSKPTRFSVIQKLAVVTLGLLLVAGALATYSIATDFGQLIVQADKDVEIRILRGGEEVEIIDTKTKKMIRLKSGKYELEMVGGKEGLKLSTDTFVLTRGKEEIVKVTRTVPPVIPRGADQEISSAWEILPPIGFPRSHAMNVAVGDCFFILGGLDGNDAALSHVHEYGSRQGSWMARAPLPEPRHRAAVGLFEKQILVAGGWIKTIPGTDPVTTNTLFIYDIERDKWSQGPPMPIKSGSSVGGVIERNFYVVTGNDGSNAVNRLHVFDMDKRTWTELRPPPRPHELGAGAVIGGKFYVVGGNIFPQGVTDALDVYDPEKGWENKAPMPAARWNLGAVVVQGKLYAVGGGD